MNFFSAEGRTAKPLPGPAKTFWFFISAHQLALFHKPGPNRSLYQLTGHFKDEKDTLIRPNARHFPNSLTELTVALMNR